MNEIDKIVSVLRKHEFDLSDGFEYYLPAYRKSQEQELRSIANEIYNSHVAPGHPMLKALLKHLCDISEALDFDIDNWHMVKEAKEALREC